MAKSFFSLLQTNVLNRLTGRPTPGSIVSLNSPRLET